MSHELKITDLDGCDINLINNKIYKSDDNRFKDTINIDIDMIAEVDITKKQALQIVNYLNKFLAE